MKTAIALCALILAGCTMPRYADPIAGAKAAADQLAAQCNVLQQRMIADRDTDPATYQEVRQCWADADELDDRTSAMRVRYDQMAVQHSSADLQSAGQSMQDAGAAYGRAAASLPPPPTPPAPLPSPDLSGMYSPAPQTHGCLGQVPISGPGFNPCPEP